MQGVDHVALTGDLVNVGYPPEFPIAAARLRPLGGPQVVSIIPGNHDAYIRKSLPAMFRQFAPFMAGDEPTSEPFPYLRQRGEIALIGVNTGVPTAPFFATGTVGKPQRERLASLLAETRRAGLFRIVMIHHPPLRKGVKFGRGLTDARQFETILAEQGAELVLHGHNHRFSLMAARGPHGLIPVLGVGSASAVPGTPHHLAEYNLIRIEAGREKPITVERRGLNMQTRNIETLQWLEA
jgi:3',5'-cyclic AMP phosphodiesterase CpdA